MINRLIEMRCMCWGKSKENGQTYTFDACTIVESGGCEIVDHK